jgi:hypothetical protein
MNETDTPRTDEQVNGKPCTRFAIMAGDSLRDAMVPSEFARQLERELAEARGQRDTLAEALEFALNNALASGESENALRSALAAVKGGTP